MLIAQKHYRPALKLLAFTRLHDDTPSPRGDEMIAALREKMPPTAFAGAQALGEALTLEKIQAKIEEGNTDF
jgi:hypothetical protein